MAVSDRTLCHLGLTADLCAYDHVAARVPQGREGDRSNRSCPCHDDRKASLSINSGDRGQRVVWKCQAGCDPADIRAALLGLGIHESCLGRYGMPKRLAVPGLRIVGQDAALVADAKRWQATALMSADRRQLRTMRLLPFAAAVSRVALCVGLSRARTFDMGRASLADVAVSSITRSQRGFKVK